MDKHQFNKFINEISKNKFEDPRLITHELLSRNISAVQLFDSAEKKSYGFLTIISSFIIFYMQSTIRFIQILYISLLTKLFWKSQVEDKYEDVYMIDTYLLAGNTLKEKKYTEKYVPLLFDYLISKGKKIYIYPHIQFKQSDLYSYRSFLKIVQKSNENFILGEQLITTLDFLNLLYYILTFPFLCLKLNNESTGPHSNAFKYANIQSLRITDCYSFYRYLVTKRLEKFKFKSINSIGWYENQAVQKSYIKGLRSINSNIKITGCQNLIFPLKAPHYEVTSSEISQNIVPDKILLNGQYYVDQLSPEVKHRYSVGPSFRYQYIFNNEPIDSTNKSNSILVCLPYYRDISLKIMNTIQCTSLKQFEFHVKLHPASGLKETDFRIQENIKFTDKNLQKAFSNVKILITGASGTAVEALCAGVYCLELEPSLGSRHASYLVDAGKEEVWTSFQNSQEIISFVKKKLDEPFNDKSRELYINNLFTRISDDNMKNLFLS